MAKKAKAGKKQRAVKLAKSAIPAGFKTVNVSGSFGATHDFRVNPVCTGRVKGIDKVKTEDGPRRVMRVETEQGERGVWESHQLKGLFDTKGIVGKQVYIHFLGKENIGKGKTVNVFEAAIR